MTNISQSKKLGDGSRDEKNPLNSASTYPQSMWNAMLRKAMLQCYFLGKGSLAEFAVIENSKLEKFKNRPC